MSPGVLIAGGKSRRMGRDKRFLKVGGKSVFDRTLSLLMDTFVETVVVLAEPIESLEVRGCRVVYDVIPECRQFGWFVYRAIGGLSAEDICRSL
jgi:molybdopterin-guanine dinucleotide biosynthesis protein A